MLETGTETRRLIMDSWKTQAAFLIANIDNKEVPKEAIKEFLVKLSDCLLIDKQVNNSQRIIVASVGPLG
jgi:hypothetical protein